MADTTNTTTELVDALRNGQQMDEDGVMVSVSRQACEEAADLITAQAAEIARMKMLEEASEHVLHDIDDLVANSQGVAGLHQNGDVAEWDTILAGGSFGAWLASVEGLRAALNGGAVPASDATTISQALAVPEIKALVEAAKEGLTGLVWAMDHLAQHGTVSVSVAVAYDRLDAALAALKGGA
jgi:hypothetical protein